MFSLFSKYAPHFGAHVIAFQTLLKGHALIVLLFLYSQSWYRAVLQLHLLIYLAIFVLILLIQQSS